jgi:hypothetical protein
MPWVRGSPLEDVDLPPFSMEKKKGAWHVIQTTFAVNKFKREEVHMCWIQFTSPFLFFTLFAERKALLNPQPTFFVHLPVCLRS